MPIKSTKTATKTGSKSLKSSSKISENKVLEKKDSAKKVVVKRRKIDLKPTKASAVAIVLQANRAKKKALIEKVANSDIVPSSTTVPSDNKIPLWVWIFFGCSLLLFCVSFYQAIIRPQIQKENVVVNESWIEEDLPEELDYQEEESDEGVISDENLDYSEVEVNQGIEVPKTANDIIEEYFRRLSNRDYDGTFDLMIPALRGYADIRNHFTSLRMDPFLDGVVGGKLEPKNIVYIKTSSQGKDIYNFDLSYEMEGNQEKYEETWEFGINTQGDNPKIYSIRCISSKCSYHPIFWPENFGLMR